MNNSREYNCGDYEIELFGNGFCDSQMMLDEQFGFEKPVPRLYITQNKKDIKMLFEYFGGKDEDIKLTYENLLAIRNNVDKLIYRIECCK